MHEQIPPHFQLSFAPQAHASAQVTATCVRFTVLTERLIRLEYSPDEQFEDRPSQVFWYRQQPVPSFDVTRTTEQLTITTPYLQLTYQLAAQHLTPDSVQISSRQAEPPFMWRFGQEEADNLRGTYRTLDRVSGATPLEKGVLSRAGWTVVDDSRTLVFNEQGWLEPRYATSGSLDLYFFGYGRAYQECLDDYTALTGPTPLIPRWALGNWWSRYWAYTQEELTGVMREFQAHDVPLSVCIVDMDWHITDTPYHSGWTGYTWNQALFPDHVGFLDWLHQRGLRTALNLHPALGVAAHEARYPVLAERLGRDPETKETIDFDIAAPNFARAYFEVMHHPMEAEGIDFWWMDWQQGELSNLPGLDPLWWLNHLHFYDLGRDGRQRPFVFSRWGGLGNHRYPIGFSGDTHVDWPSLAFQPHFTATAANVRYGWWSHDIGGHMFGTEEPELYARWVQYGVFSPIFRLHSTNNFYHERRPWAFEPTVAQASMAAMRLRHALIPYIYSMAWRDHTKNEALIRPLYHLYPERDEAYLCPQLYTFGTELLAAPYTTPADPHTRLSRQVVWLPEGTWYDVSTGARYAGDRWHAIYGTLAHIPILAKAGGIVPLAAEQGWSDTSNPATLDVHLFAGADGRFVLYEDDGTTQAYRQDGYSTTLFEQQWHEQTLTATIHPAQGEMGHLPAERHYRLHLHGFIQPDALALHVDDVAQEVSFTYDEARGMVQVTAVTLAPHSTLVLTAQTAQATLQRPSAPTDTQVLRLLDHFRLDAATKQVMRHNIEEIVQQPTTLLTYAVPLTVSQRRALLETICQAGVHHLDYLEGEEVIVMWRNEGAAATVDLSYHLTSYIPNLWRQNQSAAEQGEVPAFKALRLPDTFKGRSYHWQFAWRYGHVAEVHYQKGAVARATPKH